MSAKRYVAEWSKSAEAKRYRAEERRKWWAAVRDTLPGRLNVDIIGTAAEPAVCVHREWNVRWLALGELLRLCVALPPAYQESAWLRTRLWCLPWNYERTRGVVRIMSRQY